MYYPVTVSAKTDLQLPLNGVPTAPVKDELAVYGNALKELIFYSVTLGSVTPSNNVYFRIFINGKQIVPESGWIRLPTTILDIEHEWILEGPPFKVSIEAYNPNPATIAFLTYIAIVGDKREADASVLTLEEVSRIREIVERKIYGVHLERIEV